MLLSLSNSLWSGYRFYHFKCNACSACHHGFFSLLKSNQGRSVCHFQLHFLSGRLFSYTCFFFCFLFFIFNCNWFPFFPGVTPGYNLNSDILRNRSLKGLDQSNTFSQTMNLSYLTVLANMGRILVFLNKNTNTGFSSRRRLRLQKFCMNSCYWTGSIWIQ